MSPTAQQRLAARTPDGRAKLVMHQRWSCLLFLHWRFEPEVLQATLPDGLHIDTFDGSAWVGIVPFMMRDVRPAGLPAVPWLSNFLELNVRTYVYDDEGTPGVWFYSLDCERAAAVWAGRNRFKLPYYHARMKCAVGQDIHYTCRRDDRYGGIPEGDFRLSVYRYKGVGEKREAAPDSLEFFLLERYYLFAQEGEKLRRGQVAHEPYVFRDAEVETFDTIPICLDDLPLPSTPPDHQCYADEVKVDIYGLQTSGA